MSKKKQLSIKSQKILDSMMEEVHKDAPAIQSITEKIKRLSTPEGRLEMANIIEKARKEESIIAPIFKKERM